MLQQDALVSDSRIARALLISIAEGSLHAIMLGAAESYLGALAVELGHDPSALALLATVPLLLAALSQLASAPLVRLLGRKPVAVLGAVGQALALLLLAVVAATQERHLIPLLLAKTAFYVAGGIMTPAWNAWIAALTVGVAREHYFGRRSAINQACVFVAFLAAGYALHWTDAAPQTFAGLLLLGVAARLGSALALSAQADVAESGQLPGPSWSALRRCRETIRDGHWRVASYLACLMLGATISTPFFTPYMLLKLQMGYGVFAQLSATSLLSKALVFPLFHRVAKRVGLPQLLLFSGAGIASIPMLWAVATDFRWLVAVHVVSGAFWAGLEYSSFQLLLRDAPAETQTEFFSLASSLSGVLQVVGALLGGALLKSEWLSFRELFMLSGVMRALPLAILLVGPGRRHATGALRAIPTRLLSVRPSAGVLQRPILPAASVPPPGHPADTK